MRNGCSPMRLALIIALIATQAPACSVPVFRYALEHWAPDAYQVEIRHRDPLTSEQQALVSELSRNKAGNLATKVIESSDATPQLIVKHPAALKSPQIVWTGPLTENSVQAVLDSPLRRDIATKLGEGDSAVWVLLEIGDKDKDDAAAALLERELQRLSETMELPKLDDQDIKNGLVSLPDDGLRLSFPIVRLSRTDPAEQFLVQLLLATEGDLKDFREPIAFPIFGRGRVLYGLVGKGINAGNLGEASRFLIGSCSCQIKEQNPGVDLIMSADWKALMKADKLLDDELPKLSDIEGLKPILVPIPPAAQPATAAIEASGHHLGWLIAAAALIIVIGGWYWFEGRWDRRLFAAEPGRVCANLRPREAQAFLAANTDTQVLDVRSASEFAGGALPGAAHVSIGDPAFDEKVAKLDKARPVLVYCAGGYRSRKAVERLRAAGFTNIQHLHRGYMSWRAAGGRITGAS